MVAKVLAFLRLSDPAVSNPYPTGGLDDKSGPIEQADEMPLMHLDEIGSTGSQSYAGYPHEEYLAALQGRKRADKFDEMVRSDSQVTMLLTAVKNPIKAAQWFVEPYTDKKTNTIPPWAQEDADLINQILFKDMQPGWKQFLHEVLTAIEQGHTVFEVTHKVIMSDPLFGSYNSVAELGFRSQRTIEKWNLDTTTGTGKLLSVTQYAFGDLQRLIDIPAQFLMVYSLNRTGSNYEGVSMLRPCYGNYFRKSLYLRWNAVGIEKFAVGTPMAEVPEGKEQSQQYKNLVQALQAFAQHKSNYLTYPAGWKITIQNNTYDPAKVETSIDNEDRRMSKAFLANLLELGMSSSTGSYALGASLMEFLNGSIEHLAGFVEEPINRDLIPSLIKMNRGVREGYPTLKHAGISDKVGKELAEMLKALADSQYITPDDPTEVWLRKRIGAPPMSNQGQRKVKATGALGLDAGTPGVMSESFQLSERVRAAILRREKRA